MSEAEYNRIKYYCGGMVDKGADPLREIYNPENANTFPYNSHLLYTYCHACTCTPAGIIRHSVNCKRLLIIDCEK